MMNNNNNLKYKKWIDKGLEQGLTAIEISINERKTFKLSLEKGKIESCIHSDVQSLVLRGIFKNIKTSIFLEKIDDDAFNKALQILKENCQIITIQEPAIIFEGSFTYPEFKENNFDFEQIPFKNKHNLLLQLEREMSKSIYLHTIDNIIYQEIYSKKILLNSKGLDLENKNNFAYLYASGVFKKDQEIENYGKSFLTKDFTTFDPVQQAQQIISFGEKKLGGKSLSSRKYPVVFSNEMFANLLESFSGIFTGISAYRNLTKLKDKVNQIIASTKVSIIDDPFDNNAYFKEKFDEEGVACQKKSIIKNGVFKGFIHNLKTACLFNQNPTGNAFNDSIAMVNCYLVKGDKTFEQMISSINEGVYITNLIGMHAGIKIISGDLSLQASGFKIEKGKITYPVKMIVLSGNFFDVLKNIKEIACDFEFQTSGFGSASVYVGDLSIGGK